MCYSQSLRQVLWGARELRTAGLCAGPPALHGPREVGLPAAQGTLQLRPWPPGSCCCNMQISYWSAQLWKVPSNSVVAMAEKPSLSTAPSQPPASPAPCVGFSAAGSSLPTTGAGDIPATPGNHANCSYPLRSCRASPPVLKNYKQNLLWLTLQNNIYIYFFRKRGISGKIFLTGHKIAD